MQVTNRPQGNFMNGGPGGQNFFMQFGNQNGMPVGPLGPGTSEEKQQEQTENHIHSLNSFYSKMNGEDFKEDEKNNQF
jgi:hypothetical protein